MIIKIIFLVLAYLIGSVSPAFIVGKLKGKDLRKVGSKNVGGLNVYKNFGLFYAVLVIVFDIAKGIIPVLAGLTYQLNYLVIASGGSLAVLGHDFPFYLKFKGGKGTATTIGAATTLGIAWLAFKRIDLLYAGLIVVAVYLIGKVVITITQKRPFIG